MTTIEYERMIDDIVELHHNGHKKMARGMVIALERMGKDMEEVYSAIEAEERGWVQERKAHTARQKHIRRVI